MNAANPLTVEFVKDALRVAQAATEGPWKEDETFSCVRWSRPNRNIDPIICEGVDSVDAAHIAKFDPPTVISILEDWLRLRDALEKIVNEPLIALYPKDAQFKRLARAALAKQGR